MDSNQSTLIELLREVHLLALKEIERLNKEIERLNLRIVELERSHQAVISERPRPIPTQPKQRDVEDRQSAMLNEHQVARYLSISVGTVRRWRLFRNGPQYLKIGAAVRYRQRDVDRWLDSRNVRD
jgi:predicted DNA-binding transcriptional regulator AlpA